MHDVIWLRGSPTHFLVLSDRAVTKPFGMRKKGDYFEQEASTLTSYVRLHVMSEL